MVPDQITTGDLEHAARAIAGARAVMALTGAGISTAAAGVGEWSGATGRGDSSASLTMSPQEECEVSAMSVSFGRE